MHLTQQFNFKMSKSRLPCLCCSRVDIEELQGEMQKLLEKQHFITTWDPETMLPPHTDVVLEALEGKPVHAHRATLVLYYIEHIDMFT